MRNNGNGKRMSRRDRALLIRCIFLMSGIIFFSFMAFVTARGADGYGDGDSGEYGYTSPGTDPWAFPEDDEYDTYSDEDHILAARMRRTFFGEENRSVYQRRKASRVHDSVTIVINESTTSEMTSANDLQRDSSNNMTLSSWLTPKLSGGLGTTQHGEAAGGNTPTISYSNTRAHQSDSTVERSQSFTSTLTGAVTDVRPNGHLVIQARKSVNVNGEEQVVILTGIVNPVHMDSNSSVRAEYIMDMAVKYTGKGPMTRMDKRGWGSKMIDFLNPF